MCIVVSRASARGERRGERDRRPGVPHRASALEPSQSNRIVLSAAVPCVDGRQADAAAMAGDGEGNGGEARRRRNRTRSQRPSGGGRRIAGLRAREGEDNGGS